MPKKIILCPLTKCDIETGKGKEFFLLQEEEFEFEYLKCDHPSVISKLLKCFEPTLNRLRRESLNNNGFSDINEYEN